VPTIAITLLTLIDEMELLRGRLAALTGKKASGIDLSLAKDGIAFDLSIAMNADDNGPRLAYCLENQPLDGMAFSNVTVLPPLGRLPRRLTARIGAPA
jgi:hypothetical protein